MSTRNRLCLSRCLVLLALVSVSVPRGAAVVEPLHVRVVDVGKGTLIRGAIVTVNGRILTPEEDGDFLVPQGALSLMLRAPDIERQSFRAHMPRRAKVICH